MDIRTTRDLRKFLADVMVDVRDEKVSPGQAQAIAKLSSQINQSIAIEVNAALRQGLEQGKFIEATPLRLADESPAGEVEKVDREELSGEQMIWCDQCDGTVKVDDAAECKSQFCSVAARLKSADIRKS